MKHGFSNKIIHTVALQVEKAMDYSLGILWSEKIQVFVRPVISAFHNVAASLSEFFYEIGTPLWRLKPLMLVFTQNVFIFLTPLITLCNNGIDKMISFVGKYFGTIFKLITTICINVYTFLNPLIKPFREIFSKIAGLVINSGDKIWSWLYENTVNIYCYRKSLNSRYLFFHKIYNQINLLIIFYICSQILLFFNKFVGR